MAAAALTWSPDAIVVHAVETIDPARLDPGSAVGRRRAGVGRSLATRPPDGAGTGLRTR